ncbi:actin-like ATPase domain-containing protein [Rhodotorula sp. JG-1b]|nr:actin-like ATPase domain-containing protein [Rhodotorula sp. JG-1b]
MLSSLVLALVMTLALSWTPTANAASMLAIDYGTDSFKASLVKPGVPFDVLLTREGKRKAPAVVTYRGEERFVGSDAQTLATRYPQDTIASVKLLVGQSPSNPQSQLHSSLFSNVFATTARSSPAIRTSKETVPVEEALAYQLVLAKELAEEQAKESVRDVVITVPGWWAEVERKAMLDAAEIAGLRLVGLINDGAAVAVNYAMARTFPPEPSHHLIYDLGSGSLSVTLVSLRSAMLPDPLSLAETPQLKNVTSITVHGYGYDLQVGGYVFDRAVRDLLIEAFEATTGEQLEAGRKVTEDKRAMAKLLKEATRVKQILSANTAASARIEGLIDDLDFRTEITRQQLEDRTASLVPHLTDPIQTALDSAKLSLSDIESVIFVGGSSRVPVVQRAIAAKVGEEKIAKNVNADEAAVLGAALYGAGITRGFRTKDIRVQDLTPFGIDMAYEAEKSSADAEARVITTHLFPPMAKTGAKKTLTFRKTKDFAVDFSYRPSTLPDAPTGALFSTHFQGISSATANLTAEQLANATVKVNVDLDASGLLKVGKAMLVLREEDEEEGKGKDGVTDKIKNLFNRFGGSKNATADKPQSTGEAGAEGEEGAAEKEQLTEEEKVKLSVETTFASGSMGLDEKAEIKKRLRDAKTALTRKLAREEARNVLEAYVYRVRDLVEGGSRESAAFLAASVESERKAVRELQQKTAEWLFDEGESAETKELKEKKRELECLVQHILSRSTEALERPVAVEKLRSTLSRASLFVSSARENATALAASDPEAPQRFTSEELASLDKVVQDAQGWLDESEQKQAKVKAHEDPVLRVAQVERKTLDVEKELGKLEKKKAPRRRSKANNKSSASASASAKEAESTASGKEHVKDEL